MAPFVSIGIPVEREARVGERHTFAISAAFASGGVGAALMSAMMASTASKQAGMPLIVDVGGVVRSFTLNADGSYSYTPNAAAQTIPQGVTAQDCFSYTISDGGPTPHFDTTTITINITGPHADPASLELMKALYEKYVKG